MLELQPGDEVIIPDFTMAAPAFAILQNNCIPIPVDVDNTWNIDPQKIKSKITDRTKAILVVHNYGHPADLPAIKSLCDSNDLYLIEDCAEALGAQINGEIIGKQGDIACYSFYANKIITTGEGGMITCNDSNLASMVRSRKNMSFGNQSQNRFTHESIGFNFRMTNIQAAIGLGQLEYVNDAIEAKIHLANVYRKKLKDIEGLIMPPVSIGVKNVYWVFGILVTDEFGCSKGKLQDELHARGIETRSFFTPLHQQPFINQAFVKGEFPKAAYLQKHGLYLPSYVGLSEMQVDEICSTVCEIKSEFS